MTLHSSTPSGAADPAAPYTPESDPLLRRISQELARPSLATIPEIDGADAPAADVAPEPGPAPEGPTMPRHVESEPAGCALFAGSASRPLAAAVARELGAELAACRVEPFPDGEVSVEIGESVRGRDVVLLQSTAPPVNDSLVELLAFADACRRAAAARVIAVVPYFGYARADRRQGRRVPVTARLVGDLMECAGVDHVVTVDAHTPQLEECFRIPVDVLTAVPALCVALRTRIPAAATVVSPDLGGARRATEYARLLRRSLVVCHKRRLDGRRPEVEVTGISGCARGYPCLIVDDMVTTGGTVVEAVRALSDAGALSEFVVAASHGVFAPGALARLGAPGVRAVYVTDTIAPPNAGQAAELAPVGPPVHVVSVAPLLAEAVRRLLANESLHDLVAS
jgi:ribose-phosphate pyrophosphokinase